MQIQITVPIIVNGLVVCEFDAAVDIKVLSLGCSAQTYGPPELCWPTEPPEWEMEAAYVEAQEKNEAGKFVPNLVECPDELLIFVTRYIEEEKFQDRACCAIDEAESSGCYEEY